MSKDKIKAGDPPHGYDIMDETMAIDAAVRDGAFLKPGLSDIAVVIRSTSLIDKIMRVSLIAGFRANMVSKSMVTNVFEGKGPLATFSAKIEVCAGLGHILGDVRHDLKIINNVRNDFAHSWDELYLKNYSVCRSLLVTSTAPIDEEECIERQKFKRSCAGIIAHICYGVLIKVAQHRFLTANDGGVMREYDAMIKSLGSFEPSE